jgi:hypothetical protein
MDWIWIHAHHRWATKCETELNTELADERGAKPPARARRPAQSVSCLLREPNVLGQRCDYVEHRTFPVARLQHLFGYPLENEMDAGKLHANRWRERVLKSSYELRRERRRLGCAV